MEGDNYLPDLDNKKTEEQIVFEQKVFRANEAFKCKMDELILWHKSSSDCHTYPLESTKNRSAYRKHSHLFEYNLKKKVLYKKVINSDGIGK